MCSMVWANTKLASKKAMQQSDGDIFINLFVGVGPVGQTPVGVGNIFYKMSPFTHVFTDSLLVENPDAPFYLFAPNPIGEGNIRANFEYDEDSDSTFMRISHFPDNSLLIDPDEDILVPICDGYVSSGYDSHLVDCHGDLIMKYFKIGNQGGYDVYLVRIGPDGTLKHQSLVFENNNGVITRMGLLKESPLKYYQWRHYSDVNLSIDVIDSLLHRENIIVVDRILHEESLSDTMYLVAYDHFSFNSDTEVIPIGGDDMLVAAQYVSDTNFYPLTAENGVAVAKYDMRTMERKGLVMFNDYPGYENEAACLGLKKTADGAVYFLYKELGYPDGNIVVVKMDLNLNIDWKRVCKTDDLSISAPLRFPICYEDEQGNDKGIAWVGYGRRNGNDKPDLFYFAINHDGTVGINEGGIEVRPYTYYPNPAQDQLHLQYSPDVQPELVELYDLQGHLVRSQRQGLQSLDMSQLPSGTYTMQVTMEDGQLFSDKVVKE